jgi:UDP-N-acetylenolpyruvoylglucosamine reductase
MFAPEPKPEPAPAPPVEEAAAPAPQPKRKGGAQVTVKLIEEAVIKGKTYAADEVVQVSRKEADGLVEAGKATVVDAAQPPEAPA